MFRRHFIPLLATAALIASISIVASAQVGQLRGHVTLKQADGTVVPAADAVVDVFRVDMTGKSNTKTNKKGEFVFAGLFYAGDYIIAVSLPGAQPTYQPGVKVGRDVDYALELKAPGDGRQLTLAEIKTLMGDKGPASGGAKESAEDRAKREELMKKNAEIAASNEKAKSSNEIIGRAFKAGNDALKAKNYDEAIARFDEGLQADPEHPGAPALLTNKTMALNSRAVDRYNAALKSTDDAAKFGMEAAKKDWTAAKESGAKAVAMLKATPASTDPAEANSTKVNLYFALLARADSTRLFVTKVDQSQVDLGVTAYQEYLAAETDPVKKAKAQKDLAQMLFDANAFDKALVEYRKILETNPDDLDALLRSGQALLISVPSIPTRQNIRRQNYLAQFVKAPDTDR